jgi:hypothetical protein
LNCVPFFNGCTYA